MNRINRCFSDGRHKLITFCVLGDPDLRTSFKNVSAMIENGADIVELGIPFSDPLAEGPVIQKGNERALKSGVRLKDAFEFVALLRKSYDTPLLFLLYYNIIHKYGIEKFVKKCVESGLDGLIIPDLPYEEQSEIKLYSKAAGLNIISLLSVTSGERMEEISENADEFIYCVSSLGVTGERKKFTNEIFDLGIKLRSITNKKTAVGFGISEPEQAAAFTGFFDGVIVGSAFVKLCAESNRDEIPVITGEYTKNLKEAIERGRQGINP